MSFFTTSDGQTLGATTSFESGGGELAPIPAKNRVLSVVEEVGIKEYQGHSYINIKWRVLKPDTYARRVLFQKIKVWEADLAKRDNAIKMLVAIDTNANGGKLVASGQAPTNQNLQALIGRPMVLELDIWDMNGKQGNWVRSVSAHTAAPAAAPVAPVAPAPAPTPAAASFDDDLIPF